MTLRVIKLVLCFECPANISIKYRVILATFRISASLLRVSQFKTWSGLEWKGRDNLLPFFPRIWDGTLAGKFAFSEGTNSVL